MALDSRYYLVPTIQTLFRDKDSGLPLRNGYVEFYQDNARTIAKDVYILSGAPPNYTYVNIGNVVQLSSVGTFSYLGNDIAIYLFPYDGDEATTTNTVDLYFIKVYSDVGTEQFSREAWPNVFTSSEEGTIETNYVCNGQFLLHNNLPHTETYSAGEVRSAITEIAPGGWTFERVTTMGELDFVTFNRIGSYVTSPEANPRYYVGWEVQAPVAADKQFALRFDNVNRFAGTDEYTVQITGQSLTGGNFDVELILLKNFGTGGSLSTETPLTTFTFTPTESKLTHTFTFGDNTTKTIGPNDDDYIQLIWRLPSNVLSNGQFTDVILSQGAFTDLTFPPTTNRQDISCALGGGFPIPAYDGSDLGLVPISTKTGFSFDYGQVGMVFPAGYSSPRYGYLLCDGGRYDPQDLSSDGVPYSRLFNAIGNNFGNGTDYSWMTTYNTPGNSEIWLANNFGANPQPVDGSTPTGFTFTSIHDGVASDFGIKAFIIESTRVLIFNYEPIDVNVTTAAAPDAPTGTGGGTGFTFSLIPEYDNYLQFIPITVGNKIPDAPAAFFIEDLPGNAAALASTYFEFDTYKSSSVNLYYVWFTVDGVGTDPAIGSRTGIQINLLSTDVTQDIAYKIAAGMNARTATTIQFAAAGTLSGGEFWEFETSGLEFYVWYTINGMGTDPAPVGRVGIQVDLTGSETAQQVGEATITAVNTRYFAVPDLRGQFIRGLDTTGVNDNSFDLRFNPYTNISGPGIGSQQLYSIQAHNHSTGTFLEVMSGVTRNSPSDSGTRDDRTGMTGQRETRPVNVSFNHVIKY